VRNRGSVAFIAALFVVSGAAGLVDQVCFSKYLSYVVGSTAHAVSAVLAAFMAGMALGARIGGAYARRIQRPLVAYGVLELVVGVTVLATPWAFEALPGLYVALVRQAPESSVALTFFRWLLAVLVVIVPTTAMGATLPLLSRLTERFGADLRERALGVLYAANTLGGAVGSLSCVYLVLPALGLRSATIASAMASIAVGVVAITMGRSGRSDGPIAAMAAPSPVGDAQTEARPPFVLAFVAFASGALVFASEVVFVHLLVLLVGTSAYAFGVILSIFLVCLFVGAALAPRVHARYGPGALPLGLAAAAIALALTLPLWPLVPELFRGMGGRVTSFAGRELVRGLAACLALMLPATLMGLSFPLLLQNVASRSDVSRTVGRLTAINTVGSVVGSLSVGYLILPALGSQRSLIVVAGAFAAAAIVTAWSSHVTSRYKTLSLVAAAVALGVGVVAPSWNLARMTGGYNVYFDWGRGEETILWVKEDTQGGVTTVTEKEGVHTLLTNGKFQGNDGPEMSAQRGFAHYPALFVKDFKRALVIGLGTGVTLGTILHYPFEKIEVAEISPAIVSASRTYFKDIGGAALDDERVELSMEDGRNHLLISARSYDLIGIELSSVWFAGAGSLYSREFYRLVKQRLSTGGILQQWIQLHHIEAKDFAVVVHTLRSEFGHVALFYGGGQGILVASDAPLVASASRSRELERGLGVMRPDQPLLSLLDDVLLGTDELDTFVNETAAGLGLRADDLVSTDDNLYIEYATPRGNVLPWSSRETLVARLRQFRSAEAVSAMAGP